MSSKAIEKSSSIPTEVREAVCTILSWAANMAMDQMEKNARS